MVESDGNIQNTKVTKVQRFFFFFGPIMASFHVATYIVGFFSVGAVAKWITEQWFPFTRWFWTRVLEWVETYISIPQVSDVEKDALTTVVFFAPLGIYALFNRKRHPLDEKYKNAALLIGLFFVIVVGLRLLTVVIGTIFNIDRTYYPASPLGWIFLAIFALSYLALFIEGNYRKSISEISWNQIPLIFLCLAGINILILIMENVVSLGLVTSICFLSVIALAAVSIYRTPYRLSWGLGSLIAFVVSGFIFELAIHVAEFIQDANIST